MNRLSELQAEVGLMHRSDKVAGDAVMAELFALLRAAAAETVGTEWEHGIIAYETGYPIRGPVEWRKDGPSVSDRDDVQQITEAHNSDLTAARVAVADARTESERHRNDALQHAEACRTLAAERAALQRAIDEAYGIAFKAVYNEERNDLLKVYDILRPHSTAPVAENATPARQWSRTPPPAPWKCWNAFRSETTKEYVLCVNPTDDECWIDTGDELFCPWQEGDTMDTLPPVPTGSTPAVTPQPTGSTPAVSPCELVARLAEVIKNWASLPDPMMRSCVPDVDAIIAEARRETT